MKPRHAAALLALALCAQASAQELSVGLGRSVTSIDPHFHNTGPNNSVAAHVFDRLVHQDARQRLVPGLALSWRALDDLTCCDLIDELFAQTTDSTHELFEAGAPYPR